MIGFESAALPSRTGVPPLLAARTVSLTEVILKISSQNTLQILNPKRLTSPY